LLAVSGQGDFPEGERSRASLFKGGARCLKVF